MRGRRAYVVAAAAWVLVVAVGSSLVWAVISRAGEGVVSGAGATPTGGVTRSAAPRPDRTPRPTPRRTPSPTPQPTPATSSAPAAPTSPPSPTPTTPTARPAPPPARRGTWQGSAGVVVAECRGGAIRLVGAYPNSGWAVQVENRGPVHLAVRFEGGDDRGETRLDARCGQGVPAYAVAGGGSGDG